MPSQRLFRLVMKGFVMFAVVACMALAAVPADATFVNAGTTVIYDFDFTGQTPPPPYTNQMAIEFLFAGLPAIADYRVFTDPHGTGLFTDELAINGNFSLGGLTNPGLLDGVFSVRVMAVSDLDITTVKAFAANTGDTVFHISVDGIRVPEPPSVALLTVGLVILAGLARRGWLGSSLPR